MLQECVASTYAGLYWLAFDQERFAWSGKVWHTCHLTVGQQSQVSGLRRCACIPANLFIVILCAYSDILR
jgi:hypothetical protein